MHVRLLYYTGFLCLAVLTLVFLQYFLGPVTTTEDIHWSGISRYKRTDNSQVPGSLLPEHSFLPDNDTDDTILDVVGLEAPAQPANCRMDNCFDYSKCRFGFSVYVYPVAMDTVPSELYTQIINVIKGSEFYTSDPTKACAFISSIDTLNRDILSTADYVQNLQSKLTNLPYWNNGRNHIIFNLYSGTWPDYSETFGVDIGQAILAKASISVHRFRTGFDISLPLFHKTLPERGGEQGRLHNINIPAKRKYLLAFKGKRYLTGVGSISRNSLYHMHNERDVILLTTCRHGRGWERYADDRCAEDEVLYNKYDFTDLLANSTFCLVPRGRRLGSFRFLEVLQYGCIPVLLSDNWELPFSEVIDWKTAAIWADESLLYQLPYSLRTARYTRISSLQQQSQLLWSKYFSSLDKIVLTTLQIIKDRVELHRSKSYGAWNTHPGAYSLCPSYSRDLTLFPFFTKTDSTTKFTALVYITERSLSLKRILQGIASATHVHTIYLFLVGRADLTAYVTSVSRSIGRVSFHVRYISNVQDSFRLFYREFPTDAVLTIYQRDYIVTEELDFVFSVWKEYPDRLVGHLARSHLWYGGGEHPKYHYTSRVTHQYSIILSDTSVMHKYYLYRLASYLDKENNSPAMKQCSDILLNFIISDITGMPPIKVGQRVSFNPPTSGSQLTAQDSCVDTISSKFGYMPLKMSHVRLDPALFKDNVARTRKRYPNMEKTI